MSRPRAKTWDEMDHDERQTVASAVLKHAPNSAYATIIRQLGYGEPVLAEITD